MGAFARSPSLPLRIVARDKLQQESGRDIRLALYGISALSVLRFAQLLRRFGFCLLPRRPLPIVFQAYGSRDYSFRPAPRCIMPLFP
jgi:hypothetical protein